jgi:DNA phosphorothioation-associated putative methyltransferase
MTPLGKQVRGRQYVHADQVGNLDEQARTAVSTACELISARAVPSFNVVRLNNELEEVALLNYPALGLAPFPSLTSSWRVHLPTGLITYRNYAQSLNPPILHRTELLLPNEHVNRAACAALTSECESIGLFANTTIIGFQRHWMDLIREKGYELVGFALVPLGNVSESEAETPNSSSLIVPATIERHRSALSRTALSAPVQSLIRDGLLHPGKSFFDYGCGRGDDVASLQANGFRAAGWDPYYRSESERISADVANLGFVINVIEDRAERMEALERAFSLTTEVLAVAAMLATQGQPTYGRSYQDGIVTSRNTFQKYYTQGELQQYIEAVLDEDAYPAAPGVFYVFKDRAMEQTYLLSKCSDRSRVARARLATVNPLRTGRREGAVRRVKAESPEAVTYLEGLWSTCLELGRVPAIEELPSPEEAKRLFGSSRRAIAACLSRNDPGSLTRASLGRRDEILVMLALQFFGRRRRFTQFDHRFQRDVKEFFGSFQFAEAKAQQLLFSVQDKAVIAAACDDASTLGLGWLEPGHSLQLHTSLVERLPAPLRVYLGCATALAGSMTSFDLVKAHIESGKVTLMTFDNFTGKPLPALQSRIKVRLRDQDLDIFDYKGPYPPTLLFNKSRYINEEFPHYAEQVAFEDALQSLGLFDLSGYGPEEKEFHRLIGAARREVAEFELRRSTTIPALDDPCGRTFTYRQLIECGETWEKTRVKNTPALAASYNALHDLATSILDPVVEYFGAIKLTYGFASTALTKLIPGNIAPKLDQHASCETGRSGVPVSPRKGAAVDFLVEYEDMIEVAKWVAANCTFDRMYVYGVDRPLHVSVGPDTAGEIYEMRAIGGKRIPRRVTW